ncbi:MAG: hypothetical protein IPN90_00485 [Elusimicrobia bacterium]|nr:hypothetical protein [Elusimicrobiota bacterium]
MENEIQQKIAGFIGFFEVEIKKISSDEHRLHKKILFVSLLDTLSRVVFPRAGGRERFVAFISEFSLWATKCKVSLPHLSQLLTSAPEPEFENLRMHVQRLYQQWGKGEIIHLDRDSDYEEIVRFWPGGKSGGKRVAGVGLDALQHIHLLYTYRNSLVHEFRAPGYGVEFPNDNEPFYMNTKLVPDETETWELSYPESFLKLLVETCVSHLKLYLDKNMIDPYTSFTFGSYWISELN